MAHESAYFRFYAELNDFLPPGKRLRTFVHSFLLPAPVKDLIEGLGVPHTEVDLILVNGEPADFARVVRGGDRVSVYPVFESFDISTLERLRPKPLREPRFVADTHLGRLAGYLRMAGFDTVYSTGAGDEELALISATGHRILLTRDRGLLKRNAVTHGYCLRETHPGRQFEEVVRRFDLASLFAPFTRCLRCNFPLAEAAKQDVIAQLPSTTAQAYDRFHRCTGCGRVYWEGPHWRRMQAFLRAVS